MSRPVCFVVMPFRPELNYFFLYLKSYLDEKHGLQVERGDHQYLTKPLMEKVRDQVIASDVILGDITGSNPNVFYELGIAFTIGKPVIFLTQDPPEITPVDVRQFQFIRYDLARHVEFLADLDRAIRAVFAGRYKNLYDDASLLLGRLNKELGGSLSSASLEEFQRLIVAAEQTTVLPSSEDPPRYAAFLLPRIVGDSRDVEVMRRVTEWLGKAFTEE
jgi:hypothetical protein